MDLAELLGDACRRGFTSNFAIDRDCLTCSESGERIAPDNARIVASQSVDQGTDPGDDATIYLIESDTGRRGYLIVADSFHADPEKAGLIDRLHHRSV
jgi:hypothetical protein